VTLQGLREARQRLMEATEEMNLEASPASAN